MGESGTNAGRRRLRGAEARSAGGIAVLIVALGLTACGGGQRQDVTEPSGSFPVQMVKAKFPNRQSLAQNRDLELAIKNVGGQAIPDLAVTIYTGNVKAGVSATGSGQGSFNIRLENPSLADPNRPVWVLENEYPKVLTPEFTLKNLGKAPPAGAAAAQTDTFQFQSLAPGQTKDIVWRVAPVRAGTYTVHYEVAAGLEGKAKAVTRDGGPVKGNFVVTISARPPQTCVNDAGQVVAHCGP